jgi:Family of unknown function (DUF5689)
MSVYRAFGEQLCLNSNPPDLPFTLHNLPLKSKTAKINYKRESKTHNKKIQNNTVKKLSTFLLALALCAAACVKTKFDEPPLGGEPVTLKANTSIKALKALRRSTGVNTFDKITTDAVISGIVVMDDRSGNYYKSIIVQDSTGGIEVRFNDGFLFNTFPVGRTVFIQCKDLLLTDYSGTIQLTGSTVEQGGQLQGIGLTESQVRAKVQKGTIVKNIRPRVVSIADLRNPDLYSTLVEINDVQFAPVDTGKTYADAPRTTSLNRTLENCNRQTVIVRTSGYADFATALTPKGRGKVVGVLNIFSRDLQLYLRDTSDVRLSDARCGSGGGGGGGGTNPVATINEAFDGVTNSADVLLAGWANLAVKGNRVWRGTTFQTEKYVSATAFSSTLPEMESWLITPPIDLRTQKNLSIRTAWQVWKHDGLTVWVSNNFDGKNVATATWTQLNVKMAKQTDAQFAWIASGNVPLPVYANGSGYIGFKYVGDGTNNTTTWRLDDVKVQ